MLTLLNPDTFISGERLARELNISRTMLWKEIKALQIQGFDIQGITGKGYKISNLPESLSPDFIASKLLHQKHLGRQIIVFDQIESTHSKAKKMMADKYNAGTVLLAKRQTLGRGRLGRHWSSPEGGVWMSAILSPGLPVGDIYKIGLSAALSTITALSQYGLEAAVKWPNDIMLNNKKIGGVLQEAAGEADNIDKLVLSIGVNLNFRSSLISEVAPNAISAMDSLDSPVNPNEACINLINAINENIGFIYEGNWDTVYSQITKVDYLIGKEVNLVLPEKKVLSGKYGGIDSFGRLVVDTGEIKEYISMGEIVKVLYED